MRRLIVLVALLAAVVVTGAIGAQRHQLKLTAVSGVPQSADPGARFEIRGRVTRQGANAKRVIVTAQLVGGGVSRPLARKVLRRLKAGKGRRFRLSAGVPSRGVGSGDYRVRICARRAGTSRTRCVSRPLTVGGVAPEVTATPVPTTTVGPTATATGSATATATETATATATASATATATATGTPTATPTATATPPTTVGAESAGDNLFPNLGNGGYDAQGYELALSYSLGPVRTLAGTATMTAVAKQILTRFSLDLQGFTVTAVTVNGVPATFSRFGSGTDPYAAHKLRVTPATPIGSGSPFTTVVTYSGVPPEIVDPDGSKEGFAATPDGAWVANEPMGSMGWFPNNNHPSDKATFRLAMTVPTLVKVVGNGVLVSDTANGLNHTVVWNETHPMATYLAQSTIGTFSITESTHDGLPYYDALEPGPPAMGIDEEPDVLALYKDKFGPYPFSIAGSIVDTPPSPLDYGYALETQTKPIYPGAALTEAGVVSHELAHQYWGDSVSITRWQEIWLNEGFAEFSSWLYGANSCGDTTDECFDSFYDSEAENSSFWKIPPGAPPTGADIFNSDAEYNRGAMTLAALRKSVGDAVFFDILKTWAADHKYGNATIAQFIALVKAKATTKTPAAVDAFFQDWLYDGDKPTIKTF